MMSLLLLVLVVWVIVTAFGISIPDRAKQVAGVLLIIWVILFLFGGLGYPLAPWFRRPC